MVTSFDISTEDSKISSGAKYTSYVSIENFVDVF